MNRRTMIASLAGLFAAPKLWAEALRPGKFAETLQVRLAIDDDQATTRWLRCKAVSVVRRRADGMTGWLQYMFLDGPDKDGRGTPSHSRLISIEALEQKPTSHEMARALMDLSQRPEFDQIVASVTVNLSTVNPFSRQVSEQTLRF